VRRRQSVKPSLARRILWIIRDVLFLTADSLVLAFAGPTIPPPQERKPKVAIIAAHGIGDLVLLLPAIDALLLRYPRSRFTVTLVCSPGAAEFARSVVDVDEIRHVDRVKLRRNLSYRLAILRQIRREAFPIALQPNFNRDLLVEDSLMRATGAPTRIGSIGTGMFITPLARLLGDIWYSSLIPVSSGVLHELDRNAEFVRNLDPQGPDPGTCVLLPSRPSAGGRPYALFVVGCSSPLKTWPLAHFKWVARAMVEQVDVSTVFCGGPEDGVPRQDAERGNDPRFPSDIGQTSASEFLALISGARLVISNDSAAAHIAAALRVPSVCIVGGGIVGRYHPYPPDHGFGSNAPAPIGVISPMPCFDCGWSCCFSLKRGQPAPCVEGVEPGRVLAAALDLLQRPGVPRQSA